MLVKIFQNLNPTLEKGLNPINELNLVGHTVRVTGVKCLKATGLSLAAWLPW